MKATTTLLVLAIAACATSPIALAGTQDPRLRYVDYDKDKVVDIVGHYGFSTQIVVGEDETITEISIGDPEAWSIGRRGNRAYIKPSRDKPTTNLTLRTDKGRDYNFWLDAKEAKNKGRGPDMVFKVVFRHPGELSKSDARSYETQRVDRLLQAPQAVRNWNYWGCGKATLRPTEAYDDGRFTYLRFPNAQEVPAVYQENSDRTKALTNATMRGDLLVIPTVAKRFVLQKGKATACVENRSFDPYGVPLPSGTRSPGVRRVFNGMSTKSTKSLPSEPRVEEVDRAAAPSLPQVPTFDTSPLLEPAAGQKPGATP